MNKKIKNGTKNNGSSIRQKNKENLFDSIKKRPLFLIFLITLITVCLILFFSQKQDLNENILSLNYGNTLHKQHVEAIESYLNEIEVQLNGSYDSVVEDDYLYSFKEDLLWFKQREQEIYEAKGPEFFLKELAFNMALEGMLIINEDIVYDFYITDYDLRINSALKEEYFYQDFKTNIDVNEIFFSEEAKYQVFVKEYNKIMLDYFNQKVFIINNSNEIERRFIEANKLFILADPLTLS